MKGKGGFILVFVVLIILLLSAFIALGMAIVLNLQRSLKVSFDTNLKASEVANAGIEDAISWFKRQLVQPVQIFSPTGSDTENPTIGLVREYLISGNIYGRYEVPKNEVEDVSSRRGISQAGSVWKIVSYGYVYQRIDPTKKFNESPNKILGRSKLSTEIRRIGVNLPTKAAILAEKNVQIGSGGRVRAPSSTDTAIATKGKVNNPQGQIVGKILENQNMNLDPISIFGLSLEELSNLADISVSSVSQLPEKLPSSALIYIDGNAQFSRSRPLNGGGILIVNGNLNIQTSSNSNFTGIIYVAGNSSSNYEQRAPSLISGCLVVTGSVVNIQGAGEISEVAFEENVINMVKRRVGLYRRATPIIKEEIQ
ncbi:MAG: hypothetical protein N2380_02540 [bacterium]|nr:hypothetical protein [bacterium]